MGVNSRELKHLTNEVEVKVAASEVWQLYRGLGFSMLAAQHLKNVVQNLQVLKGDGRVGTVLRVTFVPGTVYKKYPLKPTFFVDRSFFCGGNETFWLFL